MCYRRQVTSWWFQAKGRPTPTALGPKFACPEACTAAQTLLEAGAVQHIYYHVHCLKQDARTCNTPSLVLRGTLIYITTNRMSISHVYMEAFET